MRRALARSREIHTSRRLAAWRVMTGAWLFALVGCTAPSSRDVVEQQLARGEELYRANCQSCHGDARTGAGALPGVPMHGPEGHTWHHSDRNLKEIILDGPGETGEMMRRMMGVPESTPRMPAWRGTLSEEEVDAILAYIKQGWTPQQRDFQQRIPMMR